MLLLVRDPAQDYLLKQGGKLTTRWSRGYFRLDDGLLAYYENKSLVRTNPKKVLAEGRKSATLSLVGGRTASDRRDRSGFRLGGGGVVLKPSGVVLVS